MSGLKHIEVANLESFGKDPRLNSVDEMLVEGENYLVKVIKSTSTAENMDELRYVIYHHSKACSFIDLPPTSLDIKEQCLRAIYNTYQYLYAMNFESVPSLDPLQYGYG